MNIMGFCDDTEQEAHEIYMQKCKEIEAKKMNRMFLNDDTEELNDYNIGYSDSSNRSEKGIHSRRGKETKRENASLMKRYGHVYDRNSY